jgi:hypothetical protein
VLLDDIHSMPVQVYEEEKSKGKIFTLSQAGFYLFILKLSISADFMRTWSERESRARLLRGRALGAQRPEPNSGLGHSVTPPHAPNRAVTKRSDFPEP